MQVWKFKVRVVFLQLSNPQITAWPLCHVHLIRKGNLNILSYTISFLDSLKGFYVHWTFCQRTTGRFDAKIWAWELGNVIHSVSITQHRHDHQASLQPPDFTSSDNLDTANSALVKMASDKHLLQREFLFHCEESTNVLYQKLFWKSISWRLEIHQFLLLPNRSQGIKK